MTVPSLAPSGVIARFAVPLGLPSLEMLTAIMKLVPPLILISRGPAGSALKYRRTHS